MFSKCFLIEAMRFSLSPKPITNPFLNKFASSLNLFINPFNLSSILSIAVSPFARSPKFTFVGAMSGTVLLFPESSSESSLSSLSLGSESLLTLSNPIKERISFAAFFAALPAFFADDAAVSAESEALSSPVLASDAALPKSDI